MKVNKTLLTVGLLLFAIMFGASVWQESPILLYIASAIPIFIVPFLPDIPTSQKLKSGDQSVEIIKRADSSGEEAEWLVVSFKPGTIQWNRKWLVIPTRAVSYGSPSTTHDYTASLTILKYDIKARKSRNGTLRINMYNLVQRSSGLSFTVNEVNRLMVRMEDLESVVALQAVTTTPVPVRSMEIQA